MAATNSRTRVFALLRDASQVGWTLLVDGALRLAFNIGVTLKTRQTLARGSTVSFIANSIDSTWRWVARINDLRLWWLCCHPVTSVERISLITLIANADRDVVSDPAVGIYATKSWARVLAFLVDTGQFLRAVGVDHTLRPTVWR